MNANEKYLSWIIPQIQYYGTYHNHKETMAWVATAFYIPGIITLGYYVPDVPTCWLLLPIFLLFSILTTLTWCFVMMQFRNRWEAHFIVVGLMRVAANLCEKKESRPDGEEYKITCGERWPIFIAREIEVAKRQKANTVDSDKMSTERVSYIAIILATLIALILVCIPYCTLHPRC